jgi:hypothetical protein
VFAVAMLAIAVVAAHPFTHSTEQVSPATRTAVFDTALAAQHRAVQVISLPRPAAPAAPAPPPVPPVADMVTQRRDSTLTFYDCMDQGFCGAMYNGENVYEGAAACSFDLEIGTRFTIPGDPTRRVYVCKDRGLLPDTHVDIFWNNPDDGWQWQGAVGSRGTIEIIEPCQVNAPPGGLPPCPQPPAPPPAPVPPPPPAPPIAGLPPAPAPEPPVPPPPPAPAPPPPEGTP